MAGGKNSGIEEREKNLIVDDDPLMGKTLPDISGISCFGALQASFRRCGLGRCGGDSLDELGRIRKTTLDFGGEMCDKIPVLTKEQKEIMEKLGFAEALFSGCSLYNTESQVIIN